MTSRVDPQAQENARKVLAANLPPRYHVLDRLERYVIGTQYEHMAHWKREDLPLFERGPCVQYPIVMRAVESHTDLCLGEGRWPLITSNPGEDDSSFDERFGLDEEQSEIVDRFINALVDRGKLKSVASELLSEAQGSKTACAVLCLRDGEPCVESVKAKHCNPTFNAERPREVDSLEIRYPYTEEYFDNATDKWSVRVLLYRRVINDQVDVTFKPLVAPENGAEPNESAWKVKTTVVHGLGFCPVLWYPFMRRSCEAGKIDGTAIHEYVTDEVDGLNYALSMRHRAALYSGDPQVVEIGVEDGDVTAPTGRQARPVYQPGDPAENMQWGDGDRRGQSAFSEQARKRGVGVIWRYANPQSKVEYLTLPADALKTLETDADALLNMLREALAYVSLDPQNAKLGIGELSGKALEWYHKKEIDRCNKIREDFGEHCLLPLISMLLRAALVYGQNAERSFRVAGVAKALPILARFMVDMTVASAEEGQAPTKVKRWFSPYLTLKWGAYFPATAADAKSDVDMTIAARGDKLITKETAVQKIKPHFPSIDDVPQYLEALEEEGRENMAKVHDAQSALMGNGETDEEDEPAEVEQTEPATPKPPRPIPPRKAPVAKKPAVVKRRVKAAKLATRQATA